MAVTQLQDLITPEVFNPYVKDLQTRKLNIIRSGAVTVDGDLETMLNGGGATFNYPFFNLLPETGEHIGSDDPNDRIVPNKVTASNLIVPRCVRTAAWQVANLNKIITNEDPLAYIGTQVADYRAGAFQRQLLATAKGIFANNASATDDYHEQNDQRLDLSILNNGAYLKGTTDFSVFALIDAISRLGDNQDGLGMIMVHSLVWANMQKQDIIDTRLPSDGSAPRYYYNGYEIIVNDLMPCTTTNGSAVCSTYIFGRDQFRTAFGDVDDPIDFDVDKFGGNGMGITTLFTKWCNTIAPRGYSYVGTGFDVGGPANTNETGALDVATSWRRVTSKKNCKMIELVTRES